MTTQFYIGAINGKSGWNSIPLGNIAGHRLTILQTEAPFGSPLLHTVIIPSQSQNYDTGIYIDESSSITINATGSWTNDGSNIRYPDGVSDTTDSNWRADQVNQFSLVGMIGAYGWFKVGAYLSGEIPSISFDNDPPPKVGRLFLAVNDTLKQHSGVDDYANNIGYLTVDISVSRTCTSEEDVYVTGQPFNALVAKFGSSNMPVALGEHLEIVLGSSDDQLLLATNGCLDGSVGYWISVDAPAASENSGDCGTGVHSNDAGN
jgi:hypothetical protein